MKAAEQSTATGADGGVSPQIPAPKATPTAGGVTVPGVSHTQGPWRWNETGYGTIYVTAAPTILRMDVCSMPCGSLPSQREQAEEARANARLIAAAPDLLDFLRDSLASWTAAGPTDAPWEARMRALLALATKEAL